jgi:DNA polymerase I-like protein with 3'-5' exonuclease and polymerase domains
MLNRKDSSQSARAATKLMTTLTPLLEKQELYSAFCQVEMPVVRVIAEMEYHGFGFDAAVCTHYQTQLDQLATALEARSHQLVGHSFNLGSPQELAQVLFVELKLPSRRAVDSSKVPLRRCWRA